MILMYKYAGFSLIGLIVVLLLPTGIDGQFNGVHMYGTTTIEQYDSHGNQIFSQTVHNLITNDGEDFITLTILVPVLPLTCSVAPN